ncbi:MAG: P-II family nitrogen regulator, partial [Actinomycetia bacterium]|nr:P-II family nitrogen regulator [Actinomycetes bacterium]
MSYQVIIAALKPDVIDAVVDAAKECGISGATIVPGRGTGQNEAKTFLGLTLETQTDVVIFLTESELVEPVLAAIQTAGRLDEHGTGVVFTLPVERVAGIKQEIVRREVARELPRSLPDLEGGVAIYGYGPEVDSLLRDLESREITSVVIEEDESVAHRLYTRGQTIVQATVTDEVPDL